MKLILLSIILLGSLAYAKVTFLNYIMPLYYFKIIPFDYDLFIVYVFNQVIILDPADLPKVILLIHTWIFEKCYKLNKIDFIITEISNKV